MWRIRFQGREWLHMDGPAHPAGPIFTAKRYSAGVIAYAHVYGDGRIARFNDNIGHVRDIEWLAPLPREERPEHPPLEETLAKAIDDPFGYYTEPEGWTDD